MIWTPGLAPDLAGNAVARPPTPRLTWTPTSQSRSSDHRVVRATRIIFDGLGATGAKCLELRDPLAGAAPLAATIEATGSRNQCPRVHTTFACSTGPSVLSSTLRHVTNADSPHSGQLVVSLDENLLRAFLEGAPPPGP